MAVAETTAVHRNKRKRESSVKRNYGTREPNSRDRRPRDAISAAVISCAGFLLAGSASAISVRGTDPAFTNALLNQVSTGDNRDIEFD